MELAKNYQVKSTPEQRKKINDLLSRGFTEINADDLIAMLTKLPKSAENPLQGMELTPEFEAVEPKFKVGDRVYTGIDEDIKVIKQVKEKFVVAPSIPFLDTHYPISEVCHATPENYEMLCKLYPHIKFEAPPKPLSGDDIVKAMLKKGIKNVLCLWGNGDKIIIDRLDYKGSLMSTNCNIVGGLTPIDWYTGEPLTEAVLGE